MIFPVKVPYTISADIVKYSGTAFTAEPDPFYLQEKRKELTSLRSDLCAQHTDAIEFIQQASEFTGRYSTSLEELALSLEEDIAILHNGIIKAICFCFPSGFIPARNIGLDFFQVHTPVADGEKLRAAGPKVSALISNEGAMFRRYVWGISSLGSLSQHPGYKRPEPKRVEDLYFRTETQTTIGLSAGVTLFFVKVDMHPLGNVWQDVEKRKLLIESVSSMTDAVLQYKHMVEIKSILLKNS
ncbi:MAG: heme-dependent oxidative N-demethylase subunit alpha family protein [Sphingobacteriales bacterium]